MRCSNRSWCVCYFAPVIAAVLLVAGCSSGESTPTTVSNVAPTPISAPTPGPTPTPDAKTLRGQAARTGFLIGTSFSWGAADEPYKLTLAKEFNYVTVFPTMLNVEPQRGTFRFAVRDVEVAFAKEHGLKIKGHPLVWGNTRVLPAWLKFDQADCGGWSPAELDQIMKEWIQATVSHFKGSITTWEVVNEPFKRDDRTMSPGPYTPSDLQDSCWKRILGEGYIAKAFSYAHEADPDALLTLNDQFNNRFGGGTFSGVAQGFPSSPGNDRLQRGKFLELVRKLKAQGVPIHVAGYQMHLDAQKGISATYLEDFRDFLQKAQEIGIQAHVTEMDVYLPTGLLPDPAQKLKEIYKGVLNTCLQFANCTAFTVWGISDKDWSPGPSASTPTGAAPLLFDAKYQPKPAYYGVMEALKRE